MADKSKIEWTDSTFNPWIGCTRVSPACDNCYAAISTPSRTRGIEWGAGKPRQRTSAANWKLPLRWNSADFRACGDCGWRGEVDTIVSDACPSCGKHENLDQARRRVFCASLADVFDNEVPAEWLADLLDLIRRTPNLDWLLLTKRIGNWRSRIQAAVFCKTYISHELATWLGEWHDGKAPANVWLGATICNQDEADRDVAKLLAVPADVRFLSIEPMLGPIDLSEWLWPIVPCVDCPCPNPTESLSGLEECCRDPELGATAIHWVICGGESGVHARAMRPLWVESLHDQCALADIPFLFKQWGEWHPATSGHGGKVGTFHGDTFMPGYGDVSEYGVENNMVFAGKRAFGYRLLSGLQCDDYPIPASK